MGAAMELGAAARWGVAATVATAGTAGGSTPRTPAMGGLLAGTNRVLPCSFEGYPHRPHFPILFY